MGERIGEENIGEERTGISPLGLETVFAPALARFAPEVASSQD